MAETPPTHPTPPTADVAPSPVAEFLSFCQWCGNNRLAVFLMAGITATLVYFFGVIQPFVNGTESAALWAKLAWNPENELDHGFLVPLATLGLFWYHREELRRAVKGGSLLGMLWVVAGILLYVLSVRCLQPRLALLSIPFLLYGMAMFLWGKPTARIILFPCAFLLFMIPVGQLQQATFRLQFIITGMVGMLSHLVGIGIQAVGTQLTATNGSFNFEIAEGCSGIRSLLAMTMLTAIFVHLTQDRLWKKVTIFLGSLLFAIIGNVCRIFSVILVAKYYDPKFAGGLYHDYSGYISVGFAFLAMLLFAHLINLDYGKLASAAGAKVKAAASKQEKKPVTYDY